MTESLWSKLDRPHYLFFFLLILSCGVRIAASIAMGLRPTPYSLDLGDEREYALQAYLLLHGQYSIDFRRPIGYVSLLALFQLISFGSFTALQLINVAVSSLAAPLAYLLVFRVVGNNFVAATTGLLVIFWPPFIYYGHTLYSEAATLPLFTLFLALIPRGSILINEPVKGRLPWFLSGALLGLCALFRPMYLLFIPFLILILLLEEKHWRRALAPALYSVLGFALVILPWSLALSIKAGTPVLISTTGGEVLAAGLNPVLIQRGYQLSTAPDGRTVQSGPGMIVAEIEDIGYLSEEELKLPSPQQDKLLRQRALEWALNNPGPALYLEGAKLANMWGFHTAILEKQTIFLSIMSVTTLIIGVLSIIRFRSYIRVLVRFWILPIYLSAVALISWGSWRFRQAGDLGLLALCALFLLSLQFSAARLMASNPSSTTASEAAPNRP